jgi:tRNA (mo5U34)-methyltransferase
LTPEEAVAAARDYPGWYHTLELPGYTTPGYADLRHVPAKALPERIAGRALEVATFDGFWAFELERRGAEVTCIDLPEGTDAQWPPNKRAHNESVARAFDLPWGRGFELAHAALRSRVNRVPCDVMDLEPARVGGTFPLVLCGTLLQHLRDPVGALQRMHGVLDPAGTLLLVETFSVPLTFRHPRRAVGELMTTSGMSFTWWMANLRALEDWARTAGFGGPSRRVFASPGQNSGPGLRLACLRFQKM